MEGGKPKWLFIFGLGGRIKKKPMTQAQTGTGRRCEVASEQFWGWSFGEENGEDDGI